jgi:hypothetical protein
MASVQSAKRLHVDGGFAVGAYSFNAKIAKTTGQSAKQ